MISSVFVHFRFAAIWPIICLVLTLLGPVLKKKYAFIADILFALSAGFISSYYTLFVLVFNATEPVANSFIKYLYSFNRWNGLFEGLVAVGLYFLLRIFIKDRRLCASLAPVVPILVALIDAYVYLFRGNEVNAADVYNISTAMSVTSQYDFWQWNILGCILAPLLLNAVTAYSFRIEKHESKFIKRLAVFGISAVVVSVFAGCFLNYSVNKSSLNLIGREGARNNGITTNIVLSIRAFKLPKPESYSVDKFRTIFDACGYTKQAAERPNIIIIMNESFADVTKYNDFYPEDGEDPIPYFHSLAEDSEHAYVGYALSSIYGGGTSISEFEALTGITDAFLAGASCSPYMMYGKEPLYSVAWQLKDYNYHTVAMHPFNGQNWNRDVVYPNLGFDDMLFIDDFEFSQSDRMPFYLSDAAAYRNVITQIENNDANSEDPLFLFLVTIQNHGGYNPETFTDLHEYVSGYPSENLYINLTNYSDIALEEFLSYLSEQDEEYIVLMFGDHHPRTDSLDNIKFSINTIEDDYYKVIPYVIWDNHGLPAGVSTRQSASEFTSINYLGLATLEAARIPLSPYFQYVANIRNTLPCISHDMFYDAQTGEYMPISQCFASPYAIEKIVAYQELQYLTLMDNENKSLIFEY